MNRHLLATACVSTYLVLALIVRPVLLRWRTGRWGLNGLSGRLGSAGWWGGVTFVASLLVIPVALTSEALAAPPLFLGMALAGIGLGLTLLAQSGMGVSWRIGVDVTERTSLVTTGLYGWMRNPIFTGMATFGVGLVMLWPNVASVASLALLILGVELQVRFVEEPYLVAQHGEVWRAWARRVGRFVPGVGRW